MSLASRQPHLAVLPAGALEALAAVPGLANELALLACHAAPLAALLRALLPPLVRAAPTSPHHERLLDAVLAGVPLGAAAPAAARCVLDGAAGEGPAARRVLQRALRVLDLRYPTALDAALAARVSEAGGGAGPAVAALLLDAFPGTKRAPLEEVEGGEGLSLQLAVDAPAPALRVAVRWRGFGSGLSGRVPAEWSEADWRPLRQREGLSRAGRGCWGSRLLPDLDPTRRSAMHPLHTK